MTLLQRHVVNSGQALIAYIVSQNIRIDGAADTVQLATDGRSNYAYKHLDAVAFYPTAAGQTATIVNGPPPSHLLMNLEERWHFLAHNTRMKMGAFVPKI